MERMETAHVMLNHVYQTMSSTSTYTDRTKAEKDLEEGMHAFYKAQDALSKAIERRSADIQVIERERDWEQGELHIAMSPVSLSDNEVEGIIKTIRTDFEGDQSPQPE